MMTRLRNWWRELLEPTPVSPEEQRIAEYERQRQR